MQGHAHNKEDRMAHMDPDDVAIALGASPLDPELPQAERIEGAIRRIESVLSTEAYAVLAEKRRHGLITAQQFAETFYAMLKEGGT